MGMGTPAQRSGPAWKDGHHGDGGWGPLLGMKVGDGWRDERREGYCPTLGVKKAVDGCWGPALRMELEVPP